MSPQQAPEIWKALVDNASSLIADAHTLLSAQSHGRARSLTVLAQEELGAGRQRPRTAAPALVLTTSETQAVSTGAVNITVTCRAPNRSPGQPARRWGAS
ncbi:AbiV family abortive infection protein [Actinacidiphila glaucinigra]|uniref:AbiV family abortive infection protein n=1 Tax=Actinacidiphila glaucinigra TaxID=235986 RepID=UPI00366D3431